MRSIADHAVSEFLGALLLLMIVLGVMFMIYSFVWDELYPNDETFITITGKVEKTNIVLEHSGGESIKADTSTSFTIADTENRVLIKDYLIDENTNGLWDFGERMVYPFEYDVNNLLAYDEIDVMTVDEEANSIILMGPLNLHPMSDIGVEVFVSDETPHNGDEVSITIVVTCYGGDVNGSANVQIQYRIPPGLEFIDYNAETGSYDPLTGLWNISILHQNNPVSITINAKVLVEEISQPTQFGVILDGSWSITDANWNLMCNGLANVIENEDFFPDDGTVELTVVQFGTSYYSGNSYTTLEISPVNITLANKENVANQIRGMTQGDGWTPMAAGVYRTADVLKESSKFSSEVRKVILLVSDGLPNCKVDEDEYFGYDCSNNNYAVGKSCTEDAREYSLSVLGMKPDEDEFDCFAVGTIGDDLDIEWLNASIAWPEPGYIGPPFNQGTGWVTHVETWTDFSDRLETVFQSFFSEINNQVLLYSAFTVDPISSNNGDVIVISPEK